MLFAQKITSAWNRFKSLQGSPNALASGTAIGVFIGFAPLMPLKSLLIFLLTAILRSSTIAALFVCTIICNPLTYLPLYYIAWLVGNLVLPGRVDWTLLQTTVNQMHQEGLIHALRTVGQIGFDTGLVLLVGGCLVALPLAVISYPLARRFFVRIELGRCEKHLLNQDSREKSS